MDSFEQDYGDPQDPERDGGPTRHDHPTEAGENEALDGELVRDRDEDGQGGQHSGPHKARVAGAGVRQVRVKGIELGHDEVNGERAPEDQGAPEGGVLGEDEEIWLTAEIFLPGHLRVHVRGLCKEVGNFRSLIVPLCCEVCLPLGICCQVFANLRDGKNYLLQRPVVPHNLTIIEC